MKMLMSVLLGLTLVSACGQEDSKSETKSFDSIGTPNSAINHKFIYKKNDWNVIENMARICSSLDSGDARACLVHKDKLKHVKFKWDYSRKPYRMQNKWGCWKFFMCTL